MAQVERVERAAAEPEFGQRVRMEFVEGAIAAAPVEGLRIRSLVGILSRVRWALQEVRRSECLLSNGQRLRRPNNNNNSNNGSRRNNNGNNNNSLRKNNNDSSSSSSSPNNNNSNSLLNSNSSSNSSPSNNNSSFNKCSIQ